ncbi:hypothetical protein H5V45_13315 [Nocardioides sp. KIGAM211]|uniref:Uncharacterized protein n=1 Tax=Nocardioides luti TaxID=2761101 RepID=A0A7X0RH96_9ACTN|nr:hypothetical protein [Nocardioides luti]MBB6628299.1 hypothetical protein [Nocardioides luti]
MAGDGELVLTRSTDDRRRYDLAGVGSVRREGLLGRSHELRPVVGRPLVARQRGFLGRSTEAVDEAGVVVGTFTQRGLLRHGGPVVWNGLPHDLTSRSSWKNGYELARDGTPLLTVEARGWGRTPARIRVHDDRVDPGLVLFTVWLVQQFVQQDAAASS